MTTPRTPPHDLAAERDTIGSVLLSRDAWAIAGPLLAPEGSDFYSDRHSRIWAAAAAVGAAGGVVDGVSVSGQIMASKAPDAHELCDAVLECTRELPRIDAIEDRCRRLRDLSAVRAVIAAGHDLLARGYGSLENPREWLDESESVLAKAAESRRFSDDGALHSCADMIGATFQRTMERAEAGGGLEGYASGFVELDAKISGFVPGKLYVVAGRPGSGKSTVAKDLSTNIARNTGKHGLIISLEMDRAEWGGRMVAADASVLYERWRDAEISREEWQRATAAAGELAQLPLSISDKSGVAVESVVRWANRLKRKHGEISFVLIDYLQLLTSTRRFDSREQEIAYFSRTMKALAKDVGAPVIALSQLNRNVESRQDKRPMISDMRESGAIEQDADVILLCYRDEYYDPESPDRGIIEINVGKQRAGKTGVVPLSWQGQYMRIANLESHHDPEDKDDSPHWNDY